jgi:L-histidine Nalpha-methyltransferase
MAIYRNQISEEMIEIETQFARDVRHGLSQEPKCLSSKYFYDEIGDAIFVQIMNMPEYYLTNCEFEILSEQNQAIIEAFQLDDGFFSLVELGAGDGTKTIELLKALEGRDFDYVPIDISSNALEQLEDRLNEELPWLKVRTRQGEYFKVLDSLPKENPKVVLFLGSNIGNFSDPLAAKFLHQLADQMLPDDSLLLGVDKKKPKEIVLPAYNDEKGLTRNFNLNLLARINRELGGDFRLENFTHFPEYDETNGVARSSLKSTVQQEVFVELLDQSFKFAKDELIHTEISKKYDLESLGQLYTGSGLHLDQVFTDERNYFYNLLLRKEA